MTNQVELKDGDHIEWRQATLSGDGLHLGGDVGPYGPWRKGIVGNLKGRHNTVWVIYVGDDRYPDHLSGLHVSRDNIRAA